ncbi:HPr family phosphocarrier protein [Alteriqipengyuania lutimaris]|uniref:HPr family phosphocarrier protein n=1 Tax=Alteriqipengyuania lutimaris TaxID=1538146 RepID=A0A395LSW5_9SPHN|nr:HPr family phosphocarrier protein [Alteriqipengyuania lutimaris]MBB3033325.1 phosphocarrier protein [Alteriqipengyuania lutimaris]RDS77640.1 HPr family phosphocarrier protein [Alteriqipengyuania lutimaris]
MSDTRKAITIVNERGLHARASAKLVEVASRWSDATRIRVAKGEREVDGRSILDLMMLGAARGDEITLIVKGEDAPAAMDEISTLIENGFGEE